jgi:hypothetical protein
MATFVSEEFPNGDSMGRKRKVNVIKELMEMGLKNLHTVWESVGV